MALWKREKSTQNSKSR